MVAAISNKMTPWGYERGGHGMVIVILIVTVMNVVSLPTLQSGIRVLHT